MGTPEENKHVVLRRIEALNAGDAEAAERLAHPDLFDHDAAAGRTEGWRLEPLDILAEDDRVAVRARVSGGGASTQEIHIWRLADGRVVEHWAAADRRARTTEEET